MLENRWTSIDCSAAPIDARYRLVGVLGRGGFGTVHAGELHGAGGFVRPVAIKMLQPECLEHAELGQRLRDEARMLALVRHRAIVQVHELTRIDGRWAVVMERVEGRDLKHALRAGPLPVSVALEIVAEVASGLAAVHEAVGPDGRPLGLVHRDVKPGNVLIGARGEVKLVDFGISRAGFAGREAATAELTFGSPRYMAPERLADAVDDRPAGDVYGLGVVAFEALTGRRLGETRPDAVRHDARVAEARAQLLAAGVGPDVAAWVSRLLAHRPEDRPTASEVERGARELRRRVDGPWLADWRPDAPVQPVSLTPTTTSARRVRPARVVAGFAALALLPIPLALGLLAVALAAAAALAAG